MFLSNVKLILEAVKSVSVIRRNKMKKRNALAGRTTVTLARKQNPALYRKYKREREKFLRMKKMINRRYKSKARQIARRKIR